MESHFRPIFPSPQETPRAAIREETHLSEQTAGQQSPAGGLPGSKAAQAKSNLFMRILIAFIVLGTLFAQAQVPKPPSVAGSASGSKNSAAKDDSSPSSAVKVDVKLVNVFVTVTDQHGAPVGNLRQEDFSLLENGVPQKIAVFDKESAMPLSIVLDIDTSLSTHKDLPLELNSAKRFAHDILRSQDALCVYEFSEIVSELIPFTANLKTIDRGIERVRPGAATALYDALYLGSQALETRQGRKVIVVITDGGDTASRVDYKEALRAAQEAEALVYSIIVVPIAASAGRDTGGEHALIQLSDDTGGKYYYADSLSQLDAAFQKISDELRTQYLLAYYPSQKLSDSSFRRIEIKVNSTPGLNVRHRSGYYTTKSRF
jgi:Ca-activated chloride channel family protein